jgi:two-component system, LuxR family, response regulator FixJ
MLSSDQVHIVDEDSRRRAKIAFDLSGSVFRTQVYEGVWELDRFAPNSGIILLNGDTGHSPLEDLTRRMSERGGYMPIAMYSSKPDTAKIVEAMLCGALDYLEWPFGADEFGAAVARIKERSSGAAEAERKRVTAETVVARLTPRETEILTRMIAGQANKAMADQLGISPRTVEIHRGNLIKKLNVGTSAAAVRVGIYAGLDSA